MTKIKLEDIDGFIREVKYANVKRIAIKQEIALADGEQVIRDNKLLQSKTATAYLLLTADKDKENKKTDVYEVKILLKTTPITSQEEAKELVDEGNKKIDELIEKLQSQVAEAHLLRGVIDG